MPSAIAANRFSNLIALDGIYRGHVAVFSVRGFLQRVAHALQQTVDDQRLAVLQRERSARRAGEIQRDRAQLGRAAVLIGGVNALPFRLVYLSRIRAAEQFQVEGEFLHLVLTAALAAFRAASLFGYNQAAGNALVREGDCLRLASLQRVKADLGARLALVVS